MPGTNFTCVVARALTASLLLVLTAGCSYWPFGKDEDNVVEAEAPADIPRIVVDVEGVDDPLAANVRAHMSLAGKPCTTAPAYIRGLTSRAEEEARTALRAYGHYRATVSVGIDTAGDCPRVTATVEPGARVVVAEVAVEIVGEARDDPAFATLLARLPVKPGAPLVHADYAATKAAVESLALQRGYLLGRFTRSALRVNPELGTAQVRIGYDSGPRYGQGELRISQDPLVVEEALVRRYLEHDRGQPYSARQVTGYYAALSASEYFDRVDVRPLISTAADGEVPIAIELTPRKRHKYRAGLGASTDEGIRGLFSYANRRVNTRGHRLTGELRASVIEQRLSGAYSIPRRHPADEWLSFQAGIRREDVDTYDTVEMQLGLSETKRRPWGWMETRFVNYNRQTFDIASDDRTTNLVIPGLRWTRSTANDPLYPTRGLAVSFEVRGSSDALLSDTDFVRAALSGQAVLGLPWRMRVLTRIDTGASWVADFRELPPSERFFAGGDRSIRGFDFEDLGPVDDTGDVIGGRYLAVASVELEKMLTERWGMAAFVDAGNAFGGAGSATGVKVSVGAGVRWRSPIGPARVDLAHPLDDDTVLRMHLRIGPDL